MFHLNSCQVLSVTEKCFTMPSDKANQNDSHTVKRLGAIWGLVSQQQTFIHDWLQRAEIRSAIFRPSANHRNARSRTNSKKALHVHECLRVTSWEDLQWSPIASPKYSTCNKKIIWEVNWTETSESCCPANEMDIWLDQPASIFSFQQQVAFPWGPFSHLPRGMLLHSSMPQTAGRPWRNGRKHAIKKQGQNTWNRLLSLLTPRAPLFSPCTLSHPHPLPPFCSTAHTVYECMNRSISSCPTPSSLPTPQPLLSPPPPLAFITMTTHNEESKRERKRAEAREKGEREGGSVTRWPLLLFLRREMTTRVEGYPDQQECKISSRQPLKLTKKKEVSFIKSNALQKGFYNVYFSRLKETINCSCWTVNRNSTTLAGLWAISDLNK